MYVCQYSEGGGACMNGGGCREGGFFYYCDAFEGRSCCSSDR